MSVTIACVTTVHGYIVFVSGDDIMRGCVLSCGEEVLSTR
jgi:hypothetical protein